MTTPSAKAQGLAEARRRFGIQDDEVAVGQPAALDYSPRLGHVLMSGRAAEAGRAEARRRWPETTPQPPAAKPAVPAIWNDDVEFPPSEPSDHASNYPGLAAARRAAQRRRTML